MPPRDPQLPEGTDHIINGAMSTGTGSATGGGGGSTGAATGSTGGGGSGTAGGTASGGGSASGFVGGASGDDTGGTTTGGGTMARNNQTSNQSGGGSSSSSSSDSGGVVEQLRSQATALRDQAGGRVRDFAESGKTRASDALEDLARVVGETADSIDERLGRDYGEYARRAADAVSGVADTLRRQEVDELYDNVRSAVRKSPGVAVGVAAVLGFTVARLIKAGLDTGGTGGTGNGTATNNGASGGTTTSAGGGGGTTGGTGGGTGGAA